MPWVIYLAYRLHNYYKLKTAMLWSGVVAGVILNYFVISNNHMAAGLFAPQDVAIFRILVNKPYTKLYAIFLGIQMAFWYKRALQDNSLTYLKNSTPLRVALYVLVVTLLGYVTLSPYPAQVDPMKWSNFHNSIFIALTRPLFIMSLMLLMVLLFTSDRNWLMRMLSHGMWCPLSKLSYIVYLVFPLVNATLLSSMP